MVFTMQPLLEAGTPARPSSVRDVVWIIIDRSTSSKCPRRSSSGLPPRNSRLPARAWFTRHSMSPYSSAGTAKKTTRPLMCSSACASSRPIAAPMSAATCALCPHACAAPVAGSPSGWPATTSASSSPNSAKVGPSPARPTASARTPVMARPARGLRPRPARVSSTSRAVFTSLKPSSGCLRMRSPRPTISSPRRSMAANTRCLSSEGVMGAPFGRYSTYPGVRMDYHHVVEAAGVISLGLVYYSFTYRWFEAGPPARRQWRPLINGVLFGVLAVVLMRSRIHVGDGHFVDARAVPIALIGLVEGGAAGWLAAAVAAAYRVLWLGG